MHYALCIPYPPYPRPGHIRRRVPSHALQFHKHPFLMLVFHHHALNTRKRPADDDNGIANHEVWHFILPNKNILIPGFYDYLETLHLSVGHGEEIVFAKFVGVKVIIIRCHSGEHRVVLQECAEVVYGGAEEQKSCVKRLVGDVLCGVVEILVGVFDVAKDWEVGFEAIVAQGDYLVVNLLCTVVRGADWEPVFDVRQQSVLYRLPVFGCSSFGIVRNYAFRIGGVAAILFANSCR